MSVVFFDDEFDEGLGFNNIVEYKTVTQNYVPQKSLKSKIMDVAKSVPQNYVPQKSLKSKIMDVAKSVPQKYVPEHRNITASLLPQSFTSVLPRVENNQESQILQDEKSDKETKIPLVLMAVGGVVAAYLFARGSK